MLTCQVYRLIRCFSFMLISLVMCLFTSCQQETVSSTQYKVLVLNSYQPSFQHASKSVDLYQEYFRKAKVNVDLKNIFLEYPYGLLEKQWEEGLQPQIDELGDWTPDLVILNNDFAVQVATLNPEWLRQYPVVYGGIVAPDDLLLDLFTNMTGFVCPPDYLANLEFIEQVTGQKEAVVELDYTYTDSIIRGYLSEAEKSFPEGYKITTVSAGSPSRNVAGDSTGRAGMRYLEQMYHESKYNAHLQVLVNSYSNLIMNRSGAPQFTATDVQFAEGDARLVGGFFPSLETQIQDQVTYAVAILEGKAPKDLPQMKHRNEYFMDYDAMLRRNMEYSQWSGKATILNVPFNVKHPYWYASFILLGLVLLSILTWVVSQLVINYLHFRKERIVENLNQQKERRNQLLLAAKCTNWMLKDGVISFHKAFANQWNKELSNMNLVDFVLLVDASQRSAFADFLAQKDDTHNQQSFRISFDGGASWHLWELIYKTYTPNEGDEILLGLMMNMDQQKDAEDQMQHAQEVSELVEMKEMFLANMNHDIRTPLAAIAGFAEVITDSESDLDDESLQTYSEIISQNSGVLLKLVDDVLNMRGDDIGKFRYYPKPTQVDELMEKAFGTNQVLAPQNLEFRLLRGKEGLTINVDSERTLQVINNFLSNAFKFTPQGFVALGWQYVDATEEVELFVIDTGVGISIEKQRKLFDRFYKTDEHHIGTGLGLHICKTLVEDQAGHIEVKSIEGAGSRFSAFFKVLKILVLILSLGLVSCGKASLQNREDNREFKVAVVHSYDALLEDYATFDKVLNEKMESAGVNVRKSTFYLDLEEIDPSSEAVIQTLDSLEKMKPDVILMDDDLGVMSMLKTDRAILHETPVVVGGLTLADWNLQHRFPLLTGWEAPIDYPKNIELAAELWDMNLVEIELDHSPVDSLRRKVLSDAIARPPFVDNSDLHCRTLSWSDLKESELKDSIVVMVISLQSPELNTEKIPHPERPITDPVAYTRNLQMYSYAYPQLIVKQDAYSDSMVDPYRSPELTAIRTNFGTSSASYIAGYFATTETVASDMADYAIQILQGVPVAKLPPSVHQAEYMMDYNALMLWGHNENMGYSYFKDRDFHIVNLPYRLAHPVLYYGLPGSGLLLLMLVVAFFARRFNRRRRWELDALKRQVEHEIRAGSMVLNSFKGTVFSYRHGYITLDEDFMKRNEFDVVTISDDEFRSYIHPDYMADFDSLLESFQQPGTYDHHLFIKYMEDKTYHWLLMHYVVNLPGEADGFSMMDDVAVMREQKIRTAQQQMQAAMEKNEFLNNISYIIRGPLSSILGFSDLLSKRFYDFTPEERNEFCVTVREQSRHLLETVNQVLELSRIESGRAEIEMEAVSPQVTMDNVLARWQAKVEEKEGVSLVYQPGRLGLQVWANAYRLESALDLLMKRVLDTTEKGLIAIGWGYNLDTREVTFFIEDTSGGLDQSEKEGLFNQSGNIDLALAHSIVSRMKGRLEVQSRVGVGSRYMISLPEMT